MKYKGGKSWYDYSACQWKYQPRIYTDFYCSFKEWANLGRGRTNFMYQLRNIIAEERPDLWEHKKQNYFDEEGNIEAKKLSFDRTGRRDGLYTEQYSAEIIKEVIYKITNRKSNVEFYSWKGTIDHIEINFPGATIPNIICLIDEYGASSTHNTLVFCIDCIYKTLHNKMTEWYDRYLYKYYNENYDIVYMYSKSENATGDYLMWKDKHLWKDIIKHKADRIYDKYGTITYK